MSTAAQCRRRRLKVGDTIIGRETYHDDGWHEAELTLLWLGKEVSVFSVRTRNDRDPEWFGPTEEANWALDCRKWRKVKK